MDKIYLYQHGGAGNHGCEAIVRSVSKILNEKMDLISFRPNDDEKYGLGEIVNNIYPVEYPKGININRLFLYFTRHILKNDKFDYCYMFRRIIKDRGNLLISIGGDLYCGKDTSLLEVVNKKITKKNKSVLLGCSIEPEKLNDKRVVQDLKKYDAIISRESITYNALIEKGIDKNVILCADPAFQLDYEFVNDIEGFEEDNTVGLNVSPLLLSYSSNSDVVKKNFNNLINYIIENTSYQIALIPHVVWSGVSDYDLLKEYYQEYKETGRVCLVEDDSCVKLKGYISKCKMFMGGRTHATIAAYSTCVPTVVFGYSVKSRGIATDLFGTTENYVLSVNEIKDDTEFVESFKWLNTNCDDIKKHLNNIIPDYKNSCFKMKDLLLSVCGEYFND